MRNAGPDTPSAAITLPSAWRTGAASVSLLRVHVGEEDLPVGRAVQRGPAADPTDRHDRARAGHLIDVHDGIARQHTEVHRLADAIGELLEDRVRGPNQIQARHRRTRQADQAESQPELPRGGVPLDQTGFGERRDQAGGGRLVHVQPPPELAHAQFPVLGDQLESFHRPRDGSESRALLVPHVATPLLIRNEGGYLVYPLTEKLEFGLISRFRE
jgi:hypothetical protein